LEASTTDLGTEMTNMIMAQKAYGMNSEVLKTTDQMLQTITQGTW
jgi:flagellar hook protein FlgE